MVISMRIDVKLTQKEILIAIYRLNQTRDIYPLMVLADETGCAQNTALRHVNSLKASGFLTVIEGTGRRPNQYILTDEGLARIQHELHPIRRPNGTTR